MKHMPEPSAHPLPLLWAYTGKMFKCACTRRFVMLAGPADNARQSLQLANVSDAALQCGPGWSSRLVRLPPAPSRPSGAAPRHQGHLQWKLGRQKQRSSSSRVLLCRNRRPAGCMHSPLPFPRPPGQRRRSGWRRRRRQQRAPRAAAAADTKQGRQVWDQPCICINTGPSAD